MLPVGYDREDCALGSPLQVRRARPRSSSRPLPSPSLATPPPPVPSQPRSADTFHVPAFPEIPCAGGATVPGVGELMMAGANERTVNMLVYLDENRRHGQSSR